MIRAVILCLFFLPTICYAGRITGGGGSGASSLNDLTDVDTTGQTVNYALLFNGTEWVAVPQGTSFSFSNASFSSNQSATQLMGVALAAWKTVGQITFSATYNNGPPIGATVTSSGWSPLPMTGSFLGPTSSVEVSSYPAAIGSKTWTLSSEKGAETDSDTLTINFYNYRFWGTTIVASGYTETDVEGIGNSELLNSKVKTFSITAAVNEYIVYAYPSRLGTATFTVGGFEGGFNLPETVSIINSAGFTEDYYVYSSINSGLGLTTVVAQ